jgi:hypothetical protein
MRKSELFASRLRIDRRRSNPYFVSIEPAARSRDNEFDIHESSIRSEALAPAISVARGKAVHAEVSPLEWSLG